MDLGYFGGRYLDNVIGKWISTDPEEQFVDAFNYCGNNPINRTDPDGRMSPGEQEHIAAQHMTSIRPGAIYGRPQSTNVSQAQAGKMGGAGQTKIISMKSLGAAMKGAFNFAGFGKNGMNKNLPTNKVDYRNGSKNQRGASGQRTEWRMGKVEVHHDEWGNFNTSSNDYIPPHFGVTLPDGESVHFTYPKPIPWRPE